MPASSACSASPSYPPPAPAEGPVLHVCITCRRGGPDMETPPGAQLLERLTAFLDAETQPGSALQPAFHTASHTAPQHASPVSEQPSVLSAVPSSPAVAQGLVPVTLHPVSCLAACDRGCTAAIAMPGRWTWLLGHLGPEKAEDLLAYARLYAASPRGTVMPSRRPASLADMVLGRLPAALYPAAEPPAAALPAAIPVAAVAPAALASVAPASAAPVQE